MSEPLKLNLGCGQNKRPGYLNVDKYGEPELQCDLEQFPWPWEDNSVDEIYMNHVLEHLGETVETYFGILKEMYRVCKPGAKLYINVPHPRHDDFITDPTHVRAVLPQSLLLFSQRMNRLYAEKGFANSPLGFYLGVDFELTQTQYMLDEPWATQLQQGNLTPEQVTQAAKQLYNVVKGINMELEVIKGQPASGELSDGAEQAQYTTAV